MKLLRRTPLSMARHVYLSKVADDEVSVASMHSTFAVDSPAKDSRQALHRRVTFDENRNVYHANRQMNREEVRELWSTSAEMKQCKAQTVFLAKEIIRAEKDNSAPLSYHRIVLGAYDACCRVTCENNTSPLTEVERQHLNKWMEISTSRIGMERICIREISQDKYARRAHVVDAVLDVQENLACGAQDGDELLRQASQSVSRTSRLFARELAHAQAMAATAAQ